MHPDVVRVRIVVHGRVQGVFYRDTCRREANARGVTGWVRNRRDGTVEAVFEGRTDDVRYMVEWAHDGPPSARVHNVETVTEPVEGEASFRVM